MGTLYRLGEIAEIGRGSSPRPISDSRYFDNGNIPWIKIADATASEKNIYKTREYVNDFGASFSRKLKPGALIIAASGTLGFPKFLGVEGCIHDGWMYFSDFKENIINRDYLYYCLITLTRYFNNLSYGAAIQNINTPILKNTKVLLPKLSIQQRIASILSAYDDLIENNNKRIKILEKMAENLYKEWFVRFRFPGHEQAEFENGIPKGWDIACLSEFGISLDSGSRPKGGIDSTLKDGIPSLGAESIQNIGQFDYSSVKYIPYDYYEKMKRGKFDGNAIFLYKDGAYIGKTTIFKNKFPFEQFSVNEHVFILKATNSDYQNYLYLTLHQKEYFNLMQNLNRNAAQPGLSQSDIVKIKIDVPSEAIVRMFNKIVDPMYDEIFELAKKNKNLTKQRDLLLPRLMSGKLKV